MILSVIYRRIAVSGDPYGCADRNDGLSAVRYIERDLAEVLVGVCELLRRETHIHGSGVDRGCLSLARECEVVLLIQRIADLHIVAVDCVLFSVIVRRVAVACYGHKHLVNCGYRLVAVNDIECDSREVLILVCELIRGKTHLSRALFSPCSFILAAEFKVILAVQRIADLHIIALHAVLRAVVYRHVMSAPDGDCGVHRCYGERSVFDSECNVAEVCVAA